MPKTLDELRAELARGLGAHRPKDLREGAPDDDMPPELSDEDLMPPKRGVDMAAMKAKARRGGGGGKYTISAGGDDAVLKFGKHAGESVSDLARDSDGRSYLKWMVRSGDFDTDLIDIIEYQLDKDG